MMLLQIRLPDFLMFHLQKGKKQMIYLVTNEFDYHISTKPK